MQVVMQPFVYGIYLQARALQYCEGMKNLSSHNFAMSVAILNETKIVSGSSDATIRVWDLDSNSCVAVLEGHECGVTCVAKLNETKIVSGSEDVTIRVWDLASHSCIAVLNGPDQEIRRLVVLNETKVISYGVTYEQGYDDPKVAIWDLTSHSWAGLPNYENAPNYGHAPFAKFNETTIICAGRCGIYLWVCFRFLCCNVARAFCAYQYRSKSRRDDNY